MDPNNPYNQDMVYNDEAPSGSTIVTQPRYGDDILDPGGNGPINISPGLGGSNACYVLKFLPDNKFYLAKKTHDDTDWEPIAFSNVSVSGPWIIDVPSVRVEIINGFNKAENVNRRKLCG